jgi:hypothetical protein
VAERILLLTFWALGIAFMLYVLVSFHRELRGGKSRPDSKTRKSSRWK